MPEITSRDNKRLVQARKVRDGKTADREIFIEGVRLAEEALRSGIRIREGFTASGFGATEREARLLEQLWSQDIEIWPVTGKIFSSIADTNSPQGIILIGERPASGRTAIEESFRAATCGPAVYLNEIGDPSNLGAVFRAGEAADSAGVIVSNNSTDAFSAKANRAAMGSNLRVPVWENADLNAAFDWALRTGLRVTAVDINGDSEYSSVDWRVPRLLVFGSEAHGLDRQVIDLADETIVIPMQNDVESLNLAVSAAVVLFEALRQRSR